MGVTTGAPLPSRLVRRLRARPSPRTLRGFAIASLAANLLLVVSGGVVRLTASGLGCPTFPRCTEQSLVPTAEMGVHGLIEFGNRMLTFVLAAVAVATLVVAWRVRPARRDVRRLALLLAFSIPVQALIGGVVVLTELNPWTVMLHFLASLVLVGLATVLMQRAIEGDEPAQPVAGRPLRRMALLTLLVAAATVYAGAVVTGTGPHAGDRDARRTGLDLLWVTQLHADLVFLLVGLSVGLLVLAHAVHAPRRAIRAAWVLVAVEAAQAVIGYTQYFTGLPIVLVAVHMLGSGLLVAAATDAWLATRARGPVAGSTLGGADERGDRGGLVEVTHQVVDVAGPSGGVSADEPHPTGPDRH
ncbi:MAG TPA: COX15/CtaA family protein [Actinomycetes bacterium]|nr:COX15/CtaA family protein [Actinomycetes bacterium]